MDFATFKRSLDGAAPPPELDGALRALWHEARGEWDTAHKCAQDQADADGAWVHAYLHRVEGDASNAGGWYRRAGRPPSTAPLADEWRDIAQALLARSGS